MYQYDGKRMNMRRRFAGQRKPVKELNKQGQHNPSHADHVKASGNSYRMKAVALDSIDGLLDALTEEMDVDFMEIGKGVAELFRAVCVATAKLPFMELKTNLITIIRNEDGLEVQFKSSLLDSDGGRKDHGILRADHDEEYDPFYGYDTDDDEEGLLYDGD